MSYVSRFFDHPAGSYFLLGPRGTGKSTWLRARYPDAAWIDLLDAEAERNYYTRPERLKDFLRAQAGRRTIVIDEIQRVPQLLPLVHQHMERDKSTRFVLTGSSARKLRSSGVDLLAGRAVLCTMHPFMAAELGDAFDLDRSLESGMVPLVLTAEQPDRTLRGYVEMYLQQEVKAEGLVRRLDDFSRFLEGRVDGGSPALLPRGPLDWKRHGADEESRQRRGAAGCRGSAAAVRRPIRHLGAHEGRRVAGDRRRPRGRRDPARRVEHEVALDPTIPYLSEEHEIAPYEVRRQWPRYWLVDPLDGTKEFVERTGEFTVNVALIEGGEPTLGVVAAPAVGLLYYARAGEGAWKREGDAPRGACGRPCRLRPIRSASSRAGPTPAPPSRRSSSR